MSVFDDMQEAASAGAPSDASASSLVDQMREAAQIQAPAPQAAKSSPADPNYNPIRNSKAPDPLKLVAHAVTGLGSSAYGGLKGSAVALSDIASDLWHGKSLSDAIDHGVNSGASAVRDAQERYTYSADPNTASGQIERQFDSKYNPLNWPGVAGQYVGGKLADAGYPGAGAAVDAGVTVFGGPAAIKGAKALSIPLADIIKPAPKPPAGPRVEPTMADKPRYRMVNGQWQQVADNPSPTVPIQPVAQVKPTLQQASPELQQTVSTAQAKGVPINKDALNRHVEAETLPVPVKLSEGQALMDPSIISEEMNTRAGKSARVSPEFYNQQGKALAQNLDVIRQSVAPDVQAVNPVQHGQVLVDSYKAMDAAKQADIGAKYQALRDANGGAFPVDGAAFVSDADAALSKQLKSEFVPPSIASQLGKFRDGSTPMTYENFEALRTNLAAAARQAERAGDGNAAAAVSTIRQSLESLPMTGETAAIKPLADAARSAAKARFDAIKADPAYKASVNDDAGVGEASPLADDFVRKYIVGGKRANIQQMRQNLADDKLAQQTIPAATVDYLRKQAKADVESGRFNAATYNETISNLSPKFDTVLDPATAQKLQQVGNVAKYTTIQPKGSYVNNSNTLTGALSEGAKSTAEGVANVAAGGVPLGTWVRKGAQAMSEKNAAKKSTATGAGITKLSDLGRRP